MRYIHTYISIYTYIRVRWVHIFVYVQNTLPAVCVRVRVCVRACIAFECVRVYRHKSTSLYTDAKIKHKHVQVYTPVME